MFFPSCKIKAAFPVEDAKLAQYLEKRWGVPASECCRANRANLTVKDEAVVVCHTCASIMEESSAASKVVYAWEYIDRDADFPFPDYQGEKITLQDCYMSKERASVQEAVRSLMKKMNFQIVELAKNRENVDFCGLRSQKPLADNQKLAPKHFCEEGTFSPLEAEERLEYLRTHVSQYKTSRTVTYCGACRAAMKQGGANVVHLLELLFLEK